MDDTLLIDENHIRFKSPDRPFNTSGAFGDVFVGRHATKGKVAVKRLRLSAETADDDEAIRRFEREGLIWRRLDFVHLLPFLGYYYKEGRICLVSPFMENGSLPKYLKRHPNANKRLLLYQTALAIAYLHNECGFIHGDIKGENILVSRDHAALLNDFGIARPEEVPTSVGSKGKGTIPWQSPELLDGESKTFESDVYAFGITISEVLSGKRPFSRYAGQGPLITAILFRKERPAKHPRRSTTGESYDFAWAVAEQCWSVDPRDRPTALSLVGYMHPDRKTDLSVVKPWRLRGPFFFN